MQDSTTMDIVKDSVNQCSPAFLFAPKNSGKFEIFQMIRQELKSVSSDSDLIEIRISFKKNNPHDQLREFLKTPGTYSDLSQYFINSELIQSNREHLVSLEDIENLLENGINWLLRNCNLLYANNKLLRKLKITLVVEGAINKDFLPESADSPFPKELKWPAEISRDFFFKYLEDSLNQIDLEYSEKLELWNISKGDFLFTQKIIDNLPDDNKDKSESHENVRDKIKEALKNYSNKGSYNDSLKWYALNSFYQINGKEFLDNIDSIESRIVQNWKYEDITFKSYCFNGGIVMNYQNRIVFRSPLIIKSIYNNAIERVKEFETVLDLEIPSDIIKIEERDSFQIEVNALKLKIYFGFVDNLIIGRAQRRNKEEIEIFATYDFRNAIHSIWVNKKDLLENNEAFLILYDYKEKPNENLRITKFFNLE
ncbi:hypothetical protein WIW50_15025 [Flavobacteriaceae bacterium 3-367]